MFEYQAEVLHVIDGDTLRCRIDLGFSIHWDHVVRLYGINCPELPTPEGEAAKQFATDWLNQHALIEGVHVTENSWGVTLRTVKDRQEKYGRYLGTILDSSGASLNGELVAAGHAKPYP